ncbi:Bug family tripartite tricarboxylate transporter substrate binding protein [Oceanispirochaeta crateris]|uniref:Bug family tripartite tricarboxylate transporter substrate binding protein n=1 Tax=Oceanispirochaeta crateris TaxID=2518645 RepID=UPI001FE44BD1|nr:tripartite tricarboxylate transporter substrate binding protein [Oceanispirochaeta crateris]
MKRMIVMIACVLLSSTALFANGTPEEYPNKDVEFIVSSGAGGGTDAISRKISQLAEKELGTAIYFVNKPGADDAVGPNLLMGAKPDGYTIGNFNYGSIINAPFTGLIKGYDLAKVQIFALITQEPDALMVTKNSPYTTFDEFIEAAKANPGKIKVADQGIGSRVNLLALKIQDFYGVQFNMISYQGSAPQREAILNGEVDAAITSLGDFAPLLNSGDAIGVVEFSSTQNGGFPTVPNSVELGLDDSLLSGSFLTLAAPVETPAEIIEKLTKAFGSAATSTEFSEWTKTVGVTPDFKSGPELKAFIDGKIEGETKALQALKDAGVL